MLTVEAMWSRPMRMPAAYSCRRLMDGSRAAQLPHRGHLRDRDVVEHAEGAEDDRGQQQPAEVEVGGEGEQGQRLLGGEPGQMGRAGEARRPAPP